VQGKLLDSTHRDIRKVIRNVVAFSANKPLHLEIIPHVPIEVQVPNTKIGHDDPFLCKILTKDYLGPMKLHIKYARPGSGNFNMYSSLKHLKPTLDKCEVKRIDSRPTLVMIPPQDKTDTFIAPSC
jgi:hypothetical protein